VRDAAIGSPERETIVERVRRLVGELDRPVRAAVHRFVNAELIGEIPMDIKYATLSLTPCTSRNCSAEAPFTVPAFQVSPPFVVTTNVPPTPAAHTTCAFTGLTAISKWFVWLFAQ